MSYLQWKVRKLGPTGLSRDQLVVNADRQQRYRKPAEGHPSTLRRTWEVVLGL